MGGTNNSNESNVHYISGTFLHKPRRARTMYSIYSINYSLTECPLCREKLETDVNFIPNTEYGDMFCLQGKYCKHCNIFLTRDHDQIRSAFFFQKRPVGYVLHSEYMITSYATWLRLLGNTPSALAVIHLKKQFDNTILSLMLVRDPQEANPENYIFHYGDPAVRCLIEAWIKQYKYVKIFNCNYDVVKIVYKDEQHPERSTDFVLKEIILKSYDNYIMALVKGSKACVFLPSNLTHELEMVNAAKNNDGKYYMNLSVYRQFVAKHGKPNLPVHSNDYGLTLDDNYRRSQTLLTEYGYNVSQNQELPDDYRHILLSEIMDLELLSKREVLQILQYNIRSHKKPKYAHACLYWERDAAFVEQYQPKPDRYRKPGTYIAHRYWPH